jgi:hypothetical protein
MTSESTIVGLEDIRFRNIIGMGLDFSSMTRLFETGSEDTLYYKIVDDIAPRIFKAKSKEEFDQIHQEFCDWGTKNIILAEKKKRDGRIIKNKGPASYGQIAKTFDVTLKVVFYYSHLPDYQTSEKISKWLNAGVDNRIMKMIRKKYANYIREWPETIEEVDKEKYFALQKAVHKFIQDEHGGKILPVQFDDMYWYKLNQ